MKIVLAKHSGFCSGVKRSAQLASSDCYQKPIFTWGPLIHNKQYVDFLKSKNINPTESFSDVINSTVIIRSHGVTKNIYDKINKVSAQLVDGTCPNVIRVHKLAEKLEKQGYQILIFGDKKHPEVIGIASYTKNPIIIQNINDAKKIKNINKAALISQTTQSIDIFNKIKTILSKKINTLLVKNTICNATKLRQLSAINLAKKVDIMIIIGGKHSSNTNKLFQSCKNITTSYHIETYTELNKIWFKNNKTIGITAGASTPDWIINKVINTINKY